MPPEQWEKCPAFFRLPGQCVLSRYISSCSYYSIIAIHLKCHKVHYFEFHFQKYPTVLTPDSLPQGATSSHTNSSTAVLCSRVYTPPRALTRNLAGTEKTVGAVLIVTKHKASTCQTFEICVLNKLIFRRTFGDARRLFSVVLRFDVSNNVRCR